MSTRARSPEALYHAIPQAPVAANPIIRSSEAPDIELEDEDLESPHHTIHGHPTPNVSSRIRLIHFILGCAVLLPWNVMITATPYFLARLSNSTLKLTFSSYLSSSFTAANVIFLAHATATSKQSPPSRQIIMTLVLLSGLTLLLTLSTWIQASAGLFFAFMLINGIAQAALGSYLQTSAIAIASLFGPSAVQPMMSGQAAVAVVVSGVQVVGALVSTWNEEVGTSDVPTAGHGGAEERSAFLFFSLSTVFLLVAAGCTVWLVRMPIYKAVAGSLESHDKFQSDNEDGETRSLVSSGPNANSGSSMRQILRINAVYHIAVSGVFFVTLAVFPPITTSIAATNTNVHPLVFSAVHFFVFGVGDLTGRFVCSYPRFLVWSPKRLLTLSLSRVLFIPLFLMCNVQRPSTSDTPYTPIINSDFLFMFILFVFALSNGYVSSMCMIAAPSIDHNPLLKGRREDIDVAATVASFCLVCGLALGSVASFAVRGAVCDCNPFIS